MKNLLLSCAAGLALISGAAGAETLQTVSPDSRNAVAVTLGFLNDGAYKGTVWQDGSTISTLKVEMKAAKKADTLILDMAANGGGVIVLTPETSAKKRKK